VNRHRRALRLDPNAFDAFGGSANFLDKGRVNLGRVAQTVEPFVSNAVDPEPARNFVRRASGDNRNEGI
jgi:hypothetical protein